MKDGKETVPDKNKTIEQDLFQNDKANPTDKTATQKKSESPKPKEAVQKKENKRRGKDSEEKKTGKNKEAEKNVKSSVNKNGKSAKTKGAGVSVDNDGEIAMKTDNDSKKAKKEKAASSPEETSAQDQPDSSPPGQEGVDTEDMKTTKKSAGSDKPEDSGISEKNKTLNPLKKGNVKIKKQRTGNKDAGKKQEPAAEKKQGSLAFSDDRGFAVDNDTHDYQKRERGRGSFWRNGAKKHRISIRETENDNEVNYIYISALKLTLALFGALIVLFGVVFLIVIYTPIIDTIPGYPGKKARRAIIENTFRLDSMTNELDMVEEYIKNVSTIMEGRIPAPVSNQFLSDSVPTPKLLGPDSVDMSLRDEMESSGRYALLVSHPSVAQKIQSMGFRPPVTGDVVKLFNPSEKIYGVGIYVNVSQQVQAIQDGTVISALWSPDGGNIIQVQHKDNFISTYKNVSSILKRTGERVVAGEALGQIDAQLSSREKPFIFELWYDGQPVDPQRYILLYGNHSNQN